VRYQRQALLHWGPARCFYNDDLYTLKLGNWTTDQIEKKFFGEIDQRALRAVELFANYDGYWEGVHEAFQDLTPYMDAQRLRTPRGLDWIKKRADISDHHQTLLVMQQFFQLHETMWFEGVWEIVRARQSPTKFIVTDEPVTFTIDVYFRVDLLIREDLNWTKPAQGPFSPLDWTLVSLSHSRSWFGIRGLIQRSYV
jgi:hypothetical protein